MNTKIASFFYENGISFNVADSSSFACVIEVSMVLAAPRRGPRPYGRRWIPGPRSGPGACGGETRPARQPAPPPLKERGALGLGVVSAALECLGWSHRDAWHTGISARARRGVSRPGVLVREAHTLRPTEGPAGADLLKVRSPECKRRQRL